MAGTQNSFMAVSLEMEDKAAPWFDDDWGQVSSRLLLSIIRLTRADSSSAEDCQDHPG